MVGRRQYPGPEAPGRSRRRAALGTPALALLMLVWWLAALVPPAAGQSPASPAASPSPAAWIRPEEVAGQADTLLQALAAAPPDSDVQRAMERVDDGLRQARPEFDGLLRKVRSAVAEGAASGELEDFTRELAATSKKLDAWDTAVAAEMKRLSEVRDDLQRSEAVWSQTRARPETAAAGSVVERRVDGSLAALAATEKALRPWRTHVLALSDRILDLRTAVATASKQIEAARVVKLENILVRNRPPLWNADLPTRLGDELPQIPDAVRMYGSGIVEYVARDVRPLVLQLLCVLAAVGLLRVLAAATPVPTVPAIRERPIQPYALGLLLTLLATPWLHPASPQRFRHLLSILAFVPATRIILASGSVQRRSRFFTVLGVLLVDRVTLVVAPLPAVVRLSMVVSMILDAVAALAIADGFGARERSLAWRRSGQLAVAVLGIGLAAEIGGWGDLGALVARGFAAVVIAALFVHAAVLGCEPVVVRLLGTALVRRSHLVDRRRPVARSRIDLALRGVGGMVWAILVLRTLGLDALALTALATALTAAFSVGALSFSIGAALAFALTLCTAMILARVVGGVLEEDVYPRAQLPRGVPFVLSTLVRYGVYSFGFLLALAAAGIELGQLTILLGGLGVGVGLGLQDLVKNFAAGLTLLLERRVHPGDIVQLPGGQVFGRVVAIGLRSTLVKPGDGSEIVVPNGDLIAGAITAWTLSDRLCRVEVAVGVAYDTDPERVIAILQAVARADARFLEHPPPTALFVRFGESSLDFVLRAWTDKGVEERAGLASALAVATHRALADAGIEVPFPQRDLRLVGVSPEAGAALADRGRSG
ncbi:MAG: mechanosensitive ion channel [Myxococcales bacterium]|nr:mechanosensitive ion channel [Myxococcales bacterium]